MQEEKLKVRWGIIVHIKVSGNCLCRNGTEWGGFHRQHEECWSGARGKRHQTRCKGNQNQVGAIFLEFRDKEFRNTSQQIRYKCPRHWEWPWGSGSEGGADDEDWWPQVRPRPPQQGRGGVQQTPGGEGLVVPAILMRIRNCYKWSHSRLCTRGKSRCDPLCRGISRLPRDPG